MPLNTNVVKQSVFVGNVVVEARKHMSRIVSFQTDEVGNMVSVKIENVIDRLTLLHKELDTVEVIEKRSSNAPPCDLGVEMRPREIFLSRKPC